MPWHEMTLMRKILPHLYHFFEPTLAYDYGEAIKVLRKQPALTQAELGQLVGAHSITVSRWEADAIVPSPYQSALLDEFKEAADRETYGRSVKNLLAGVGIDAAILLLLQATSKK